MGDLRVLLGEVMGAAIGIRATMDDMDAIQIDQIVGPSDQYGHDELASAFATFADRWQVGVAALLGDADTIADGLDLTVITYANTDRANAEALGIPITDELAVEAGGR